MCLFCSGVVLDSIPFCIHFRVIVLCNTLWIQLFITQCPNRVIMDRYAENSPFTSDFIFFTMNIDMHNENVFQPWRFANTKNSFCLVLCIVALRLLCRSTNYQYSCSVTIGTSAGQLHILWDRLWSSAETRLCHSVATKYYNKQTTAGCFAHSYFIICLCHLQHIQEILYLNSVLINFMHLF